MASVKIATLLIRTIAKPISAQIKNQVKNHDRFRNFCVNLAQLMYRSEIKLRTNILGEPAKHIRPLSETRAIENGANALAEGFLFTVAVSIILGESWRSSRNQTRRRDSVDDQLEDLASNISELNARVDGLANGWEQRLAEERQRTDQLSQILRRTLELGVRGIEAWSHTLPPPVTTSEKLALPLIPSSPSTTSETPPAL